MSPNWELHWLDFDLPLSWRPGWRQHPRQPGQQPAHHPVQGLRFICQLGSRQRKRWLLHQHLLQVPLRATGGRVVRDIDTRVATLQSAFEQHETGGFSTPKEKKEVCSQPQDWGTDYFCGVSQGHRSDSKCQSFYTAGNHNIDQQIDSVTTSEWYCDGIVIYCDMFVCLFLFAFCFFTYQTLQYSNLWCSTSHKWALSTT